MSSFNVTLNALDLIAERHKALSSNLANMDTPNYKRKDVSFSHYLPTAGALETKLSAMMGPSPVVVETSNKRINAVEELSEMQKNSILYTIASRRMSNIITEMKTVINVGS
ncbi:hypothetical protein IJD44_10315 [bacterium]|nr:hypothetical protein [bacterium]